MRKNYLICLVGLLTLFNLSCDKEEKVMEEETNYCLNETLKKQTTLDSIQMSEIIQNIYLTGEVDFNSDKVFQYTSLFDGFTTYVNFSLGDKVSKGQVLAEIKSPDLNILAEERKNLASRIKVAKRELSAIQSMYNDKLASERELIAARAELNSLESELSTLNRNYTMYNPTGRGSFQIKAPASGYIIQKNISADTQISEGMELFTISALDKIWVMANVYVTDMQHVKEGMPVKIKFLAYPDEIYEGVITGLSPSFDAEERVLKAKIEIPNTKMNLKPGMTADVIVEQTTNEKALAVQADEVIFDDNRYFVIIYHDDCNLEIRQINPKTRNNEVYFVTGGLKEGEKIITQNQLLIYEELKL